MESVQITPAQQDMLRKAARTATTPKKQGVKDEPEEEKGVDPSTKSKTGDVTLKVFNLDEKIDWEDPGLNKNQGSKKKSASSQNSEGDKASTGKISNGATLGHQALNWQDHQEPLNIEDYLEPLNLQAHQFLPPEFSTADQFTAYLL